jgi:hypothetical protein
LYRSGWLKKSRSESLAAVAAFPGSRNTDRAPVASPAEPQLQSPHGPARHHLQPGLPDSIAIDRRNVAGASGTARVERCLNDAARCRMIAFRTNAV